MSATAKEEELVTKEDLERLATKGQVDKVAIQVTENTEKLDKVAIRVTKNSESINKMVTKEEFKKSQREVLSGQDKMMTILQRLDQERVFTTEWIKRIETDVEKNRKEIDGIKLKLAIS